MAVDPIVQSLADEFMSGRPMLMTHVGALTRWLSKRASTTAEAIGLCKGDLGMSDEHARALASLAGFQGAERER